MAAEVHGFQTEVSKLLTLLAKSLYSNKEVFLREIISNASDAIDKLRFLSITDPSLLGDDAAFCIRVKVDKDAKTLTVTDNGIGMTLEEANLHLGTIAKSGSLAFKQKLEEGEQSDVDIIGQFGVGFYSAFMVADEGTVVSINVFYTVIKTIENQHITLPNGGLSNAAIVNYSAEQTRRLDLTFGGAYGSDINKVRDILLQTAEDYALVLEDPEPVVVLDKQNESSLDFILRCWTDRTNYWEARYFLNEEVTKKFVENGVEIPFPQMDVHMK